MAELLTEFPAASKHQNATWDYGKYCDGRIYRLKGGVDLPEDYTRATRALYSAAERHGKKMRIRREYKDPFVIVVQAFDRD